MDTRIELGDNPHDYNLPYPAWYENQREMAQRCVRLEPGQMLILESPTGSGKSGLPATVSHFRPGTTAVIGTRDLQAQYRDSLDFNIVWGQSHYPCVHPDRVAEFTTVYGVQPTRADCPYRKVMACDYYTDCPYERAKIDAMGAKAKALNFAYAFYAKWWKDCCVDLFCDEAHSLPRVLSDLVSVEMANATRQRLNLPQFPIIYETDAQSSYSTQMWLSRAISTLSRQISTIQDERQRISARRTKLALERLAKALSVAEPDDWYIEVKYGKFKAQPVIPAQYADSIVTSRARSTVLMSATIGDPSVLAGELGVDDYEFVSLPHIFPLANRPVLWLQSAPKLSRKSGDADYAKQGELIAGILREHVGEKGIIHTVSWQHTKLIAELLSRAGLGDRVYVPQGERTQAIEKFKMATNGTVAISPSWKEGLSFDDDLARFAVIAKIPFESLANPVTRLRLKRKGGRKWYRWQAALKVVQAAGRIVRNASDWGVTYIVDSNWPMVSGYAPKWFEVETI